MSKVSEEIRLSTIFDTGYLTARRGLFIIPCKYAIHATTRMRPNSCLIRRTLFRVLDSDSEISDEDCLFVVSTGRETRAGGREGASRRCSGNTWDLCRSFPRRRSPLASIDSDCLTLWSRDRTVLCTLPLDRLAEHKQEDAPVGQEHLLVDRPGVTLPFILETS